MHATLFDDHSRYSLLPFTHTRPAADIRCGILTMRERWERLLQTPTSTITEDYLQQVFPFESSHEGLLINGAVFATEELLGAISNLKPGQKLVANDRIIAARPDTANLTFNTLPQVTYSLEMVQFTGNLHVLTNTWDIFSLNDYAIRADYSLLTNNRTSAPIPSNVIVSGAENLFIEEGAVINAGCIINASTGPVYIGKDAEVLEGSMLRGPIALGEHAVIKMGAKVYGATTIGPGCKVGGEISNVVFFANSNKGHDGYLGNAVIGEWCNLGADTNCSNLKNNYDVIKIWSEHQNKLINSGLQFCGLLMGDHSKCGINTMFNTGTVVGVSANIYGSGFPEKFLPSFTWGGAEGMTTYAFDKAMDTANRMMARRNKQLAAEEIEMFRHVYNQTEKQRNLIQQ